MNARQLALRRQLLVASATLQRVRLAHEVHLLRDACRPASWAAPALGGAVLALRALRLWRAWRRLRAR
ncbi:MAG TPA: hypothetical protein VFQ20_07860 [Burkholderiaceae bacterium]|nr:hypothetical protein [Burkholderiaceae bacterium]